MQRNFPPDVFVVDHEGLLFSRFEKGRHSVVLAASKSYSAPAGLWEPSVVTPLLRAPEALTALAQRIRREYGKLDRVSVLLPDSWFRISILETTSLPDRKTEAEEIIRWSLKRILPIRPEDFRIAYQPLGRSDEGARVLVVAALEKTLAAIEASFEAAGVEVVLIESTGLNLWNAIAVREPATSADRAFFYLRDGDFTTAVFRGESPLFVRSRALGGERPLLQEIRLSASYVAETLKAASIEKCYVAGSELDSGLVEEVGRHFGAPAVNVSLGDFAEYSSAVDPRGMEAELAACTGVFTA